MLSVAADDERQMTGAVPDRQRLTAGQRMLAGGVSGVVEVLLTHPIDFGA